MPKSTFLNLSKSKQEKIFNVGKKEFSIFSLNDASVNRITENAKISKGSFYQYFNDKKEFYWYIIKIMIKDKVTKYDELLDIHKGDLIKVEEAQLKELITLMKDEEYEGVLRNLFLYSFHDIMFHVFDHDEVNLSMIYQIFLSHDNDLYNISSEEDFNAFFDMLRTLGNACIIGILNHSYSEEYAFNLYKKQVGYIMNGIISL